MGDGSGLLFSYPNTNTIYRSSPDGRRERSSGPRADTAGVDIGRYHQPGSNGLAFSPRRALTICQHGNRRVIRVEPHGVITVLAERFEGKRLNSPNDLVYRSDGTFYFTDPPFGLPEAFDDPDRELPSAGSSGSGRARCRSHGWSSRGRTGSPSRPTSATCTSATGTSTARS